MTDFSRLATRDSQLLRLLWLVGFSFWMGGFVFYTSYVVPILREEVGESGIVTRHVAVIFNRLGAVVLAYWFLVWWIERRQPAWRTTALVLLILNAALQACLFSAYPWLAAAPQELSDPVFYFRHRVYLWLHTIQFLLSVCTLAITLRRWQLTDRAFRPNGAGSQSPGSPASGAPWVAIDANNEP
jgi:hypothetical protein